MSRSAEALVEPQMLVWAREAACLDTRMASIKAAVKEDRLIEWETGNSRPTTKQLRKLAQIYRQSFAAFFLPSPPDEHVPRLHDYRRLAGAGKIELSYELVMELRHAADRRNIALELLALDKKDVPSFNLTSTMGDDPERVAERIRDLLNINDNQQQRWKDNRIAFNALREAGEAAGIIIFQATGVRVEEMRGFSISEYPLPAVVVNRKDAYAGRSFTLIHEIAHLTLRTNGLCDLASPTNDYQGDSAEVFCNYVAGATIAPARLLLADRDIATAKKPLRWSDDKLAALARQFSTSREMILRRLLILNLTTGAYYEEKRKQYVEELKLIKREGRFLSPPKDVISSAGRKYTRTVLEALNAGHITANDASDYLGLRLKHLHVISESIGV